MLPALPCPIRDPFDLAAAEAAQAVRTLPRDLAIAVVGSRHVRTIGPEWCVRTVDAACARLVRGIDRHDAELARECAVEMDSARCARIRELRMRSAPLPGGYGDW